MKRVLAIAILALAACGDDGPAQDPDARVDAAIDAGGPDASCFTDPQTHIELINACTSAEKIDKRPVLPLLLPDGGLPPLP